MRLGDYKALRPTDQSLLPNETGSNGPAATVEAVRAEGRKPLSDAQFSEVAVQVDLSQPLPENVLKHSVLKRTWNGVGLTVSEFHCAGRVAQHLLHEDATRLSVLMEEVGTHCEPRIREHLPCSIAYTPRHMHFAPAGMEMWGYSDYTRFVRDATVTFDLDALSERLALNLDSGVYTAPRLRFSDDRIWTLVKLLSEVMTDPDPSIQLYGDGLTAAIAARLFSDPTTTPSESRGLAPWQLRRVVEYLNAQLPLRVELADLAALTRLSQSHFSRAFKASTGMAPYRWQLDARIRRAQALLIDTSMSLDDVAEATGFADAVHFGRTFRRLTGATPAAWRNERRH